MWLFSGSQWASATETARGSPFISSFAKNWQPEEVDLGFGGEQQFRMNQKTFWDLQAPSGAFIGIDKHATSHILCPTPSWPLSARRSRTYWCVVSGNTDHLGSRRGREVDSWLSVRGCRQFRSHVLWIRYLSCQMCVYESFGCFWTHIRCRNQLSRPYGSLMFPSTVKMKLAIQNHALILRVCIPYEAKTRSVFKMKPQKQC